MELLLYNAVLSWGRTEMRLGRWEGGVRGRIRGPPRLTQSKFLNAKVSNVCLHLQIIIIN